MGRLFKPFLRPLGSLPLPLDYFIVNARDRVRQVHEFELRVNRGENRSAAAAACGIAPGSAAKSLWIAKAFTAAACEALGTATLENLSASHLEAVAKLPAAHRADLLKLAAKERMSVRDLKAAARHARAEGPAAVGLIGGETQFKGVATALRMYAEWSDESLRRVMNGPCGPLIREVAEHGARLLPRLGDEEAA